MSFRRALWMIPAAAVVHNAEEYPKMVAYARRRGWDMSETQWRVALALMTLVPMLMTLVSVSGAKEGLRSYLALLLPSALSLNALDHLRQTIQYRDYSPGTLTGTCINIPLSLYIYWRALREDHLSTRILALVATTGPLVLGAMLLVSHRIGRLVAKLLNDKQ